RVNLGEFLRCPMFSFDVRVLARPLRAVAFGANVGLVTRCDRSPVGVDIEVAVCLLDRTPASELTLLDLHVERISLAQHGPSRIHRLIPRPFHSGVVLARATEEAAEQLFTLRVS